MADLLTSFRDSANKFIIIIPTGKLWIIRVLVKYFVGQIAKHTSWGAKHKKATHRQVKALSSESLKNVETEIEHSFFRSVRVWKRHWHFLKVATTHLIFRVWCICFFLFHGNIIIFSIDRLGIQFANFGDSIAVSGTSRYIFYQLYASEHSVLIAYQSN